MSVFRFKQFSILHKKSAMKVGTDGVLLGAWTTVKGKKRILDIGSGNGLIALMLAQRNKKATVHGVEIDKNACDEMEENFRGSPWSKRLVPIWNNVNEFQSDQKFDLIVSNPPYFAKGTLAPEKARQNARHDSQLTHKSLINATIRLLEDDGIASFILPTKEAENFILAMQSNGLFLTKKTSFISKPHKQPERILMQFEKTNHFLEESKVVHYNKDGIWHDHYVTLTKDFYLKL